MVSQNDLIKKTKSKWPDQNGHVEIDLTKLTTSQVRHLSLLDHFLPVFLEKKIVNFWSGIHNM